MRGWFDVRPPGGGLAFYVGFMVVIATCLLVASILGKFDDPFMEWVATGMFVVGVGLWLKHSWARWVAFTFFSLVALLSVIYLVNHGISVKGVIRLLIVLSTLHALWVWDVWPAEAINTTPAADYDLEEDDVDSEAVDEEFDEEEDDDAGDMSPAERPSFWSMRQ